MRGPERCFPRLWSVRGARQRGGDVEIGDTARLSATTVNPIHDACPGRLRPRRFLSAPASVPDSDARSLKLSSGDRPDGSEPRQQRHIRCVLAERASGHEQTMSADWNRAASLLHRAGGADACRAATLDLNKQWELYL